MKGKIEVIVKVTDETRSFPITEEFNYKRDNTFESVEEWLELFKNILYNNGFNWIKEINVEDKENE